MADDPNKPEAEAPAPEKPSPAPPQAASQPAASPAAEKPPAPKAAPARPAGPAAVSWDSPLAARFKEQFGPGVDPLSYLNQNYLQVDHALVRDVLRLLRDDFQFDYCVDITAVHYPKRERPLDLIWILYSFANNERLRVRAQFADGEPVPTGVPLWPAANWLEREVFDMFGVRFEGHPDLKRILLPDGWKGHPLRKDYGILQQDQEWVQINLGIESGQ
jgi:NADH-quinone oxidoreductase subunit C